MTTREALHRIVDELPAERLSEAEQALRTVGKRTLAEILRDAPIDDEPLTPEEECALDLADAAIDAGDTISHEELKKLLAE